MNRLHELVFIEVSKPLLTEFSIHHGLESCDIVSFLNIAREEMGLMKKEPNDACMCVSFRTFKPQKKKYERVY